MHQAYPQARRYRRSSTTPVPLHDDDSEDEAEDEEQDESDEIEVGHSHGDALAKASKVFSKMYVCN